MESIIELLAKGWTTKDILENYPQLASEDIQAFTEAVQLMNTLHSRCELPFNCLEEVTSSFLI